MRVLPRIQMSFGYPLPHQGAPPPWQPLEQVAAIAFVRSDAIKTSTLGGGFFAIGESNVPPLARLRSAPPS
jgi:hypothetical protein